MTSPHDIPQRQAANNMAISGSPVDRHFHFLPPSPIPTRRNRTLSQSEKVLRAPVKRGVIKSFCRQKGHGFIIPDDDKLGTLFVHISDIEGEFVPKEGDEVTFRTIEIPPRNEKLQAAHVVITHLKPGVRHERWDSPPAAPDTTDQS